MIVVISFGTVKSRLVCSGQRTDSIGNSHVTTPATLYAQVETYRWFLFWTDFDATITWEIQPGGANGYGYYTDSRFGRPITDFYRTKDYGSWSPLSNRIRVLMSSINDDDAFDGICHTIGGEGDTTG
jgi:hypothetical protein